jgi:membrane protease YdiL (CAAX protease family)
MKKMVGILGLLVISLAISVVGGHYDTSPRYQFNLAWKIPPHSSSATHFTDLDGDGLTEILYFDKDETDNSIFVVVDTFGERMWSIPFEKKPRYLMFHDVDEDGYEEIYLTTELTSYSEENERGEGRRKIDCYAWDGDFLWTHTWNIHPECNEYTTERRKYGFADFNEDGIEDIIVNNFIISTDGTLLHTYGDDFTYIGGTCRSDMSTCHLVLVREKAYYKVGWDEYTLHCKIVYPNGTIIWEKECTEVTRSVVEDTEGEKQFFLIHSDRIIEIDLSTFEETLLLEFEGSDFNILPKFYIEDINNDGQREYIVTINEYSDYGRGIIHVFNQALEPLWSYDDPSFSTEIIDLDGDGYHEFLLTYVVDIGSFGASPQVYRVLAHDGSERWTMLLHDRAFSIEDIDLDADGDRELIFEMDLESKTCAYDDLSLEESLRKLRELMENPPPPQPRSEYMYVFGPHGNIENQIEIPFSGTHTFHDLDGDGDEDLVYHVKDIDEGLYIYTNTRFSGPLDENSEGGLLREMEWGDTGVTREFSQDPALYYGLKKIKYFFKKPYFTPLHYRRKMSVFLSIPVILGMIGTVFLTTMLKKENVTWNTPWGFKRAVTYLAFLFFPPAGLIYVVYKIWRSDSEYRRALGFIRISKWHLVGAAIIGIVLLLISWGATYLFFLSGLYTPDTETAEFVRTYSALAFLSIVITAPFMEEILFTGYLYPLIRKKIGITKGIFIVALLFAIVHLEFVMIPLFFAGAVVKTMAYERTHCIFVAIIIHFINNIFSFVIIFL